MNLLSTSILLSLVAISLISNVAATTCLRYTIPPAEERRRKMVWQKVNSVTFFKGQRLTSFPPRGRFQNSVNNQEVEFNMVYTVTPPMTGTTPINTVRLGNNPIDAGTPQVRNQFKYEWVVNGHPFRSWWLNSDSSCSATDNDRLGSNLNLDSIVVYVLR